MKQSMQTLTSQETDEWYTPAPYIEMVREVLGEIDLDPASSDLAQTIVKANRYFTIDDDGLSKPWHASTVFVNVPGTHNGATRWSRKFIEEYIEGHFESGVLLCFAKLGYGWFNLLLRDMPVCLAYDRIAFIESHTMQPKMDKGGKALTAKHGSAFVYFGNDYDKFKEVFEMIGKVT